MTDYKQLCAELLSELKNAIRVIYREDGTRHISSADPVIAKADAALAEPELPAMTESNKQQQPTTKTGITTERLDNIRSINYPDPSPERRPTNPFTGRPVAEESSAAQPADGEVAELVAVVGDVAMEASSEGRHELCAQLMNVADLLERLASPACLVVNPPPEAVQALKAAGPGRIELMPADPPQPVPVSERLPVPVAWCRTDEFSNAMKRGSSFNGWKDPGAGANKCDMRLYALLPQPH